MVAINQREVLLCCKPRDFGNLIFIYVDQRDGSFGYHLLNKPKGRFWFALHHIWGHFQVHSHDFQRNPC